MWQITILNFLAILMVRIIVQNNRFTSGTYDRVFDITPNGVTLQQAGITLAYQPKFK